MNRKIVNKILSAVLTLSLVFGAMSLTLNVAAESDLQIATVEKTDFNYVALGASNVAGYGLHGYNFDEIYEYPKDRDLEDRRGYKMNPEGSYPVLLQEKLNETYNTKLEVIAASSMRAEEVHMLLDDTYSGDSYTDMWFFADNGNSNSPINWGYKPGVYEYRIFAEKGVEGYNLDPNYKPTQMEALVALRRATQESVRNADLITVDAGMNNFGTYMLNLVRSGKVFDSDLGLISPEIEKYYDDMRNYVIGIVSKFMGNANFDNSFMQGFIDTLAYAAVGYCLNTDAIMEHIFDLNPDVEVVLVGAQSMLHGLQVELPGIEGEIPFGDIYDLLVNTCNLYSAVLSPYADKYCFASVSENGHVEFLKDEILNYNGTPSTIGENIKECFDVLDGTLYLKTRIQQMFAIQMSEAGFINMTNEQKDMNDITAFYNGFHYERYQNPDYPSITLTKGNMTLKEFINKGDADQLSGDEQTNYEKYKRILNVAYDVVMEIFREGARYDKINLAVITNSSISGSVNVSSVVMGLFSEAMSDALVDENYSFNMDELYPDGYFNTYEQENNLPSGVLCTIFSYAMFMSFASSAFSHPSYGGHREVYDAVLKAYTQKIKGKDVISDQMSLYYVPDRDSYYVAVSGGNAGYAPIFADSIGLGKNQVGYTSLDNLDYSKINKADLISIGFDEAGMLGFATDQIFAYIGNYISTYVRTTLNDYIVDVMGSIPLLSMFGFGAQASEMINSAIDDILAEDIFAGKTMVEMNWSELLEGDDLATIELLRGEMKNAVTDSMGEENYTITFDVVEMIAENADSFNLNGTAASLIKNKTLMYNLLDKNAYLNIEIPVSEGVAYAVEAHLYGYFDHMVKAEKLISYIHANNPKAQIVLMGSFNPIRNAYMDLGEGATNIGELYSFLTLSCNLPLLMQYSESHTNSTFIYAFDAKSIYDASVEAGEADGDFMTFLSEFATDRSILNYTAESNKYVAEQMLYYVRSSCENHKYSDACDTICNRCEAEREVPHRYSDCDDTICNNCGFEREALAHVYDGCDDTACDNCGKERKAISHVLDGCIGTYCSACGKTVDAIGHSFGEWTVTKKPGFLSKGEESRSCSACGYTEARAIDGSNNNEDSDVVGGSDSSNDGLVIVIILAVVVVGAAGFLVYWFVIRKKVVKAPEAEESAESESHKLENTKPTEESTDEVTSEEKAEDNESSNG